MKPVHFDNMTPWARNALYPEERALVREAGVTVSGKSPRGPWYALGPGYTYDQRSIDPDSVVYMRDIRGAVNRAAGRVILDGLAGERYRAAEEGEADG